MQKGIESVPFKYMLLILVSAIIFGAFMYVLTQLNASAMFLAKASNATLHGVLNQSLSDALKVR
jgi:hypothetical protein